MAIMKSFSMALLLLLLSSSMYCLISDAKTEQQKQSTYIVHMAKSQMPSHFAEHRYWYDAELRAVSGEVPGELLYAYDTVTHGFSARLTSAAAAALSRVPGVLSVVPEVRYELHTTRTPEFLGLDEATALAPDYAGAESDVVVGVLDTGVWPERRSYDDAGFGPVPASWKGECEDGRDFKSACSKKLIGARSFSKGYEASMGPMDDTKESRSPRDNDGHGTHTSSTAAGSAVTDANLFGFASGTARGMAPKARVAVYKVCWVGGCFSSDILAAMDKAVDDGCNVLSLSLGGGMSDYYRDSVAIGAFNAMAKGVVVSCSAGNAGPTASTLSNVAPWILTVGAGTIDRDFPAYVVLGNGKNYSGVSLYSSKSLSMLPFVYAGNATNSTNGNLCMPGTLIPGEVAGKIVLCDRGVSARVQKGFVVKEAGGAGMVLANTVANGEELVADAHLIAGLGVGQRAGDEIKKYLFSDPNPTATIIFGGTKVGISPSPVVAAFSSRGPNTVTPDILKPDLIAPGVNILAGWTDAAGPTGLAVDNRRTEFNIISGTSMSCPHVSGLAALPKGAHPDWSPAAIKSALMTTAYATYSSGAGAGILDVATGLAATPYDYGAGHVDPPKAVDPGLVYDLEVDDYIDFLCALNYTSAQIASMAKRANYKCDANRSYSIAALNYPSFAVDFGSAGSSTVRHVRTLTNVGAPATYKVSTSPAPAGVKLSVEPNELTFLSVGQKISYTVSFTSKQGSAPDSGEPAFGRLEWSDGKHVVGSPIVFTWT